MRLFGASLNAVEIRATFIHPPILFPIFMCMCVLHMYSARGGARLMSIFILHHSSTFFIESNSELANLVSHAGLRLLGGITYFCLPKLELQAAAMPTQHLCGFWGVWIWSPCQCSKCFKHWTIFPVLPVPFFGWSLAGPCELNHLGLRFLIHFPRQS